MADIEKETSKEPLTGRPAIMEMYKSSNPDTEGEPDDDSLWGFAHNRYADLEGRHKSLSDANTRLAGLVAKDPKLAAVISILLGDEPKSLPYAVANVYGKEPFDLEGEALEEFESGYQENLKRLADSQKLQDQAMDNIGKYQERLEKYGKDNSLTGEQLDQVHGAVVQMAESILMGDIPDSIIDLAYKGLNYDKDVQEAAQTGVIEGKNQKIEAKMKEKTGSSPVPDLGNSSGAGINKPAPKKKEKSFFDEMKDVEQ